MNHFRIKNSRGTFHINISAIRCTAEKQQGVVESMWVLESNGLRLLCFKCDIPQKDLHKNAQNSFVYNNPNRTQPRCPPIGKWINKLRCIHHGIPFSNKQNELLTLSKPWVNLELCSVKELHPVHTLCSHYMKSFITGKANPWRKKSEHWLFLEAEVGMYLLGWWSCSSA